MWVGSYDCAAGAFGDDSLNFFVGDEAFFVAEDDYCYQPTLNPVAQGVHADSQFWSGFGVGVSGLGGWHN